MTKLLKNPMARLDTDAPRDYAKQASENAQKAADTVTEQAREYGEKMQEAARQARPYVEKSLREQPLITLAGVAAIGFLLGTLWKK
jgi:ElaB/YqjD/DUF883 family membrane-anchored ribosome-binding protein